MQRIDGNSHEIPAIHPCSSHDFDVRGEQIICGATVIPSSFNATLNGVDITSLFHPTPGHGEVVPIDLQQGKNVLVLSLNGNLQNRVATDTDRLVFNVQ